MIDKKKAGASIAELMPYIIAGVNIGVLANRQITQTQLIVLFSVHSRKQCPMKNLADYMHISMPTISGIVDRLVQAGYLERFTDSNDRRQVMVRLSAQGQKLIIKVKSMISSRWQEVLSELNQKELENFYQVVTKLTQTLSKNR